MGTDTKFTGNEFVKYFNRKEVQLIGKAAQNIDKQITTHQ